MGPLCGKREHIKVVSEQSRMKKTNTVGPHGSNQFLTSVTLTDHGTLDKSLLPSVPPREAVTEVPADMELLPVPLEQRYSDLWESLKWHLLVIRIRRKAIRDSGVTGQEYEKIAYATGKSVHPIQKVSWAREF